MFHPANMGHSWSFNSSWIKRRMWKLEVGWGYSLHYPGVFNKPQRVPVPSPFKTKMSQNKSQKRQVVVWDWGQVSFLLEQISISKLPLFLHHEFPKNPLWTKSQCQETVNHWTAPLKTTQKTLPLKHSNFSCFWTNNKNWNKAVVERRSYANSPNIFFVQVYNWTGQLRQKTNVNQQSLQRKVQNWRHKPHYPSESGVNLIWK